MRRNERILIINACVKLDEAQKLISEAVAALITGKDEPEEDNKE